MLCSSVSLTLIFPCENIIYAFLNLNRSNQQITVAHVPEGPED